VGTHPTNGHAPHIAALRVDPARTTVRHDPEQLPEYVEGAGDDPDLFRLLTPSPRRAFDLGILSSDPWFHVFVEAPHDVDVLGAVVGRARKRLEGRGMPSDVVYVTTSIILPRRGQSCCPPGSVRCWHKASPRYSTASAEGFPRRVRRRRPRGARPRSPKS